MIHSQNMAFFNVTPPAAIVDNAALTCNVIDTAGYDYCQIVMIFGAMDIAVSAAKVQESDTKASGTSLTSGADVTGTVWGTASNIAGSTSTLPSATDDNKFFVWDIDCKARKRYLLPVITCGDGAAGTYVTVIAILSNAAILPTSASDRGCKEILRV